MSNNSSKPPPSKPAVIPQNNRQFHREAVTRELVQKTANRKRNRTKPNTVRSTQDGFEYAIQADGSLLAEHKWRQGRDEKKEAYQPPPQRQPSQLIWSLQKLQQELGASRTRHQQRQKLPPKPVDKPQKIVPLYQPSPDEAPSSSAHLASSKSLPPPVQKLEGPGPLSQPYSFQSNQNQCNANTSAVHQSTVSAQNPYNKGGAPAISELARSHQNPPSNSVHIIPSQPATDMDMEFDDGLDDVLANMDEDDLLSHSIPSAPRRVTNDVFPSSSFTHDSSHNNSNGFDYGDSSFGGVGTGNNFNSNANSHRPNANDGTPLCPGHSLPCQIMTSRSPKNPGRQFYKCSMPGMEQQCEFFEWVDGNNFNADSGNPYNNNIESGNTHQYQPSLNQQSLPHGDNDYGGASNGNGYNGVGFDDTNAGASNTPLCPGHNVPCRIFTSKSEANPGRQFYKCAISESDQQCDFFEWADLDGNTNASSNWVQTTLPNAPAPRPLTGCKDIHAENRRVFGHSKFRKGQQEIIEHAVSGRDVFVLMPTGGGKSLCYQLPAWCCPGLSVVISPLLSLIQDQVQIMTKAGVTSVFLNSSQDYETEQREITRQLFSTTADTGVKLLYLTPEKLRHSNVIQQILARLYQNNLLSRFVIDEAHCLSDWGHDFRPDYSALNVLRESYPRVPLMALTATANEKVVNDAIRALRMSDPFRYKSSFNRPNLHYEVRKKDSKSEDAMCDYIVKQYEDNSRTSGVIYCLSRKDCEKLSERLQEKLNKRGMFSIRVSYYHAELDPHERERRHSQWSNGSLSVLCATIAFGMGIDKPDVRFVFHYSLPKSITHYYQESGRAGRDGERADCILYYSYKDKQVLEGMIRKSSNNPFGQSTRRKIDQLYACLRYCEDDFRCRRTLQLEFFGESFDKSKCRGTCDNCRAGREIDKRDLTDVAQSLLGLLSSIQSQRKNGQGVTLLQLTELFRGSKSKSATKFLNISRLQGYGAASRFDLKRKQDIDRISHAMIFDRIIVEISEQNKQGYSSDYVQPGENATAVRNGGRRFLVEFPKPKAKGKENASSVAPANKKRKKSPAPKKKTKASARKGRSGKSNTASLSESATGPQIFSLLDDDDDDDSEEERSEDHPVSETPTVSTFLPQPVVLKLKKRITKLVGMWAEEEQMAGNSVYYWHILTNKAIKTIATQCPTTLDELKAVDGLGEQKFKEYGQRLIKNIQNFVQLEGLEQYLSQKKNATDSCLDAVDGGVKPPSTKPKATQKKRKMEAISSLDLNGGLNKGEGTSVDDEFPLDFDPAALLDI